MSVKLYKRTDLILPTIIITAGFWMVLVIEALFGLGPIGSSVIPRPFLVGLTAMLVGTAWVVIYQISLYPKYGY